MENSLCNKKYVDSEGLLYFYSKLQLIIQNITNIYNIEELEKKFGIKSGPTSSRPTIDLKIGLIYFDTDLNKPIWWDGTRWIDSNGDNADFLHKGNSDQQPNAKEVSVGYTYYNETEKVLYVSNGETWEITNCCGTIDDVIIWANITKNATTYDLYDHIGWSNLTDDSYEEIEDFESWSNI